MIKTVIVFSIIFLCFPIQAQEVPKKANTVIITDTLSQQILFSKVSDLLFEYGYGIHNSDKQSGTITTTEKPYKNGVIKLNFLIKDNRMILRGDFRSDISLELYGVTSEPTWMSIENRGQKNSAGRNAWDEMIRFVSALPGSKEFVLR